MSDTRRHPSPRTMGRAAAFCTVIAASTLLLAGCGSDGGLEEIEWLSDPNIDIVVPIPAGWHQVIDSSNPSIPEMVFPIICTESRRVACATGLARIATFAAPSAEAAAQTVKRAVGTSPGVRLGSTISQGPGKVGHRDGYRLRFTFSNPSAELVSEVAAVPTGPSSPDAQGNHEFSMALVWVSNAPGAPNHEVIDQIIGSALVLGSHA